MLSLLTLSWILLLGTFHHYDKIPEGHNLKWGKIYLAHVCRDFGPWMLVLYTHGWKIRFKVAHIMVSRKGWRKAFRPRLWKFQPPNFLHLVARPYLLMVHPSTDSLINSYVGGNNTFINQMSIKIITGWDFLLFHIQPKPDDNVSLTIVIFWNVFCNPMTQL